MTFLVMAERCNECLYGPNAIVSNERRKEVLAECEAMDGHFICHKATMADRDVCCRGDFDGPRGGGKLGRMAKYFKVVHFVNEGDL